VEEEVQHPHCDPFINFPSVTYEIKYLLVNVACMVDKVALGQFYLRALRFSPVSYHSTSAPFIHHSGLDNGPYRSYGNC
jgi:hypothetical protein